MEDHSENTEGLTHCFSDYICFCENSVVPSKKSLLPNNKPMINKDTEEEDTFHG